MLPSRELWNGLNHFRASWEHLVLSSQRWVCHLQPHPTGPYTLFIPFPMRQANTVMTILGFTSTRSSGRAYTLAPIFRAIEMAYLKRRKKEEWGEPEQQKYHSYSHYIHYILLYTIYYILYIIQNSLLVRLKQFTGILPLFWVNLGLTKLLTSSDLLSGLLNLLFVLRGLPSSCHFWCLHHEYCLRLYRSRKSHETE